MCYKLCAKMCEISCKILYSKDGKDGYYHATFNIMSTKIFSFQNTQWHRKYIDVIFWNRIKSTFEPIPQSTFGMWNRLVDKQDGNAITEITNRGFFENEILQLGVSYMLITIKKYRKRGIFRNKFTTVLLKKVFIHEYAEWSKSKLNVHLRDQWELSE